MTTKEMASICSGTCYYCETFQWQEFARKARRFVKMEQDARCKKFVRDIEKRVRNKGDK